VRLTGLLKRGMPGPSAGFHRPPTTARPQRSPLHHLAEAIDWSPATLELPCPVH
jgi:hypothetical protein